MASLNKVMIIGNLGKDPEMRYTPNGSPVTNFSVAVSRRSKTPEGENREETEWFRVTCWEKLAETANTYLTKGKQVYVEGRLRTHSWDDAQSGQKRYSTEVVASNFQMLGQRGETSGGDSFGEGAGDPGTAPNDDLDNMPF